MLLDELFASRDTVKLSDLKRKFRESLSMVQSAMYDDAVTQGWYRIRPDRTRAIWVGIGVLVLAAGIGSDDPVRLLHVARDRSPRDRRHRPCAR